MTRLPTENRNITARPDLEPYELNFVCAGPGCTAEATDDHHLWRRSFGKEFSQAWWVEFPDGVVAPNRVGLCRRCHRWVTENTVRIVYYNRVFLWVGREGENRPLSPQPGERTSGPGTDTLEVIPGKPCPKCKRKVPEPFKGEKKRQSSVWSIRVPNDAAEDGIEALKVLVEDAGKLLGKEGHPPYHVLTAALYFFVTSYRGEA